MSESLVLIGGGRGPQGPPGADGADGAQGPQGDPGPAAGSEIASAILTSIYSLTSAWADVPGWQIVVPAGSGPHEIGVPEGLMVNLVSGTNAIATLIQAEAAVLDELDAMIAYTKWSYVQVTASSKNIGFCVPLGRGGLPGPASDKTYRVQARMTLAGTSGAASNIFTAVAGFTNPTLRAIRR